jgi:hypothetical protein
MTQGQSENMKTVDGKANVGDVPNTNQEWQRMAFQCRK